jgi:glyceraldehyde-3-phosphate dehydrogenase (NADP+)
MKNYQLFINGKWIQGEMRPIRSPYDGDIAGEVSFGGKKELDTALDSAISSFEIMRKMPHHARADLLFKIADGISKNHEELAKAICDEAGKPISLARMEVSRAASVFLYAAHEAKKPFKGELIEMDADSSGTGRLGIVRRYPVGVVFAISPFNFPLNLSCHKIAPALAAGCSVIHKPASQTPMCALILARICCEAGLPDGALNTVPCSGKTAESIIADDRIRKITFTGSAEIGWHIKKTAFKKKVTLELGGNAAAIVTDDADLPSAAVRLATGAFVYAGQVCISVQRIFAQQSIYQKFIDLLVSAAKEKIICGNPKDEKVICGPMIDSENAGRIMEWIEEAKNAGAKVLCGGERHGNLITPVVLAGVDPDLRIASEEAFGPVVVVSPYKEFNDAIAIVNDSKFGLQAGIYTNDIKKMMKAYDEIETGALIHNDYPTFRMDAMPYGGVKESGFGREGLKYAIEEMTEPRLLVIKKD